MWALILLLVPLCLSSPELLHPKNGCIKDLVASFITGSTCQTLSQESKSTLALKMTDCLLDQMGKPMLLCQNSQDCDLKGDNWYSVCNQRNTFTSFFTHIDNLCHFYWEVSKAERAEQITEALMRSAEHTKNSLDLNSRNTNEILVMQQTLRSQILSSLANQQQMSEMLNASSMTIASLTNQISGSLSQIHKDIDTHYAVVSRILSALDQLLANLEFLQSYMIASASSLEGMVFFITLVVVLTVGCLLSENIRRKYRQCLILVTANFLLEYFLGSAITYLISIQQLRFIVLLLMAAFVLLSHQSPQHRLEAALQSARIERLMHKTMKNQIEELVRLRAADLVPLHSDGRQG